MHSYVLQEVVESYDRANPEKTYHIEEDSFFFSFFSFKFLSFFFYIYHFPYFSMSSFSLFSSFSFYSLSLDFFFPSDSRKPINHRIFLSSFSLLPPPLTSALLKFRACYSQFFVFAFSPTPSLQTLENTLSFTEPIIRCC